jgi:EmrB/QacA subfamily drug resistance transporter
MTVTHHSRGWTLVLTSLAFFMVALDALVVTTALPAIQRDLHVGPATLEWTVNAYALTFAAGIITAAALGDRFGRRRVFVAGLLVFTSASMACALSPTPTWLLAARAVQGIGAAAVMPLSLTILTNAFPAERRGMVVGIWGAIAGLAVAGGPLVGGAITEGIDWHWIFWVNVPIGIAGAVLSRRRLVESRGADRALDLPGLLLLTGSAGALIWGLVRSGTIGFRSGEVAAALATGLVLVALFVVWERRAPAPMLPLRLFADRSFAAAGGVAFLMTAAIMGSAFLIAQYFQYVLGNSPLHTGLSLLPWTATPMVVAPIAGAVSDRVGPRPIIVLGMTLQALGLGWFALLASEQVSYASLVLPLLIAGVGISMAIPTTPAASIGAVPPADVGKASGTNSTLQRFGGAFGVAVVTAVFTAHGELGSPAGFDAGFRPALAVAAATSLAGAGVGLLIRRRRAIAASSARREPVAQAQPEAVSA